MEGTPELEKGSEANEKWKRANDDLFSPLTASARQQQWWSNVNKKAVKAYATGKQPGKPWLPSTTRLLDK